MDIHAFSIMDRKSTNLCTVYWNVLGHSVHSTDLICRSGDYKATDYRLFNEYALLVHSKGAMILKSLDDYIEALYSIWYLA